VSEGSGIRAATTAAVLLVAVIAAVVSFVHIEHLAVTHGQTELAAMLLPVSIDGTVAAASLVMLRAARAGLGTPWLARVMLGLSVVATLAANIAYGARYGITGSLLSGWPAVAFIGSAEMALGMVRRARQAVPDALPAPVPTDADVALSGAPDDVFPAATDDARVSGHLGMPDATRRRHTRDTTRQKRRTQADIEAEALAVLSRQPGISGAELGRSVGVSDRTGQRLLTRLTNGRETASTDDT
jgi:hypothetical protein